MQSSAQRDVWFTYGPQTDDDEVLKALVEAGATGVRLTYSYGSRDLQLERARRVRRAADTKPFLIVADIQGEKWRLAPIGSTKEVHVERGEVIVLSALGADISASPKEILMQNQAIFSVVKPGDLLIEGDGAMLLSVTDCSPTSIVCTCESTGVLHPGRGITLQDRRFVPKAITDKDEADLRSIRDSGLFDGVAVSFVGTAQDVTAARSILGDQGPQIIAKIETAAGIDNVQQIAESADWLMAARGDLALALPIELLPSAVQTIADAGRAAGKPWMLATQIMEGLERFDLPTRAEVCDLSYWTRQGAQGAMLSYETAFGRRPVEAVHWTSKLLTAFAIKAASER